MSGAQEIHDDAPRRPHRIRRYALIAGIVLVILAGGLLLFLHTRPARELVLAQVTSLLQEQHIEFTTEELRYNLLDLRVALRNLRVRSQDAPDLPPFASIDRVVLDLGLRALLQRRYVLESGEAEGVAIHYVVAEDGRDNVPRPPRDTEEPGEPIDYLIENLQVRNAIVRYENRPQQIDVTLPVSRLDVEGDAATDRHSITLASRGGTLALRDRTIKVDAIDGELELGEDDARVARLDVAADAARASLSGTVAGFDDPQIDLALRGTVDAARAAAVAGVLDPIGGVIDLDVTAAGPARTPALDGRINGRDISYRNLRDVALSTHARYDMTQNRASIDALDLRAPFGSLTGNGVLSLDANSASHINVTASGLDTAIVMRGLELPYVVASRVDAEVRAEWPGIDYVNASGTASATLTPNGAPARLTIPLGGRLDVSGGMNAADAVLSGITVAGAELHGRVRLTDQKVLSGDARLTVQELAQAVTTAEAVMGEPPGGLVPTTVSGSLDSSLRLAGTLDAPTLTANVSAPALVVGTASGLSLEAAVAYAPEAVTVERMDIDWQGAQARATGTVGLTGSRPLDLTLNAKGLQVSELLRAANQPQVPASGVLSLDGRVRGTGTDPTVEATLNGSELTAYDEEWGTLAARVTMAGREVVLTNLLLEKPQPGGDGRLTGTGSYHLDRRTYSANLQTDNLQLVSFTLPDGRIVRGGLEVDAKGSGTVDQPAGNLRLAARELRIDEYEVGEVSADATVADGQAVITAEAPAYGAALNASVATESPYTTTGRLSVAGLQLTALPLELDTPLEGNLRATVDAAGELAALEQMKAVLVIDAFSGTWNQQPFSIESPARIRYEGERVAIDQLTLTAEGATIAVKGELPVNESGAPGEITLDARSDIASLARYAPAGTDASGSGELLITGAIAGNLRAIDPDLDISIANASVVTPDIQPGVSNLNLRARVAGGALEVEELTGNWGKARLDASGRMPFDVLPDLPVQVPRPGGLATFSANIQGLDLTELPNAPEGLSGLVSLAAQMTAARPELASLEGRIAFPDLQLAFNGLTLNQQQESVIALRDGSATIERFDLDGSVGTLTATGTVGLTGDRPINVDAQGKLNVAAIGLVTEDVRAEGESTVNIAARGTIAKPDLNGFVDLRSATFAVDEPTVAAEDINARVEIAGMRVSIAALTGTLNGGKLNGSGYVEFGDGGIADVALEVTGDDVAFDAPLDLRSLSDSQIALRRREDDYVLEGQITINEAGLTGDINFDQGILAALQSRRRLELTEERNPFLERLNFDVNIDTANPIIVQNNLARAEVSTDLRLIGTPYEPGLNGRLTVHEGGEITLNERQYEVEEGVITFIGERQIQPSFDLRLHTTARNYDITLALTGPPGETETTLTSDPALPEPDIMAILVTGRTLEEMRGEEFEIAQEQALSYLTGRVGSQLGRGAAQATGLDTVRIEPNLIANEANPSARLTVGEDITTNVELIYSVDLTDSSDQIWVAEYEVTRRLQTRVVRQNDDSYRLDVNHDVRLGGRPAPARALRQRPKIESVALDGSLPVAEAEVLDWLDLEEGDDFSYFDARDGVARIEEQLAKRGYLQSRVRLQREGDEKLVRVLLTVDAGPRVDLEFTGVRPPNRVAEEVRTKWRRGVFDTQRIDDAGEVLRAWLMSERYLQPIVKAAVEEAGADHRRVRFDITPGPRYSRVVLSFDGAKAISPDELNSIIEEQDLELQLFTDPLQVTELLQRYYREQGYLVASVDEPRYEFQGEQARVALDVHEGPRFFVRNVTASGTRALSAEALLADLPVQPGDPFLPFAAENALQHLRDEYWARGYNEMRGDYELVLDQDAGRVDVNFEVIEGAQTVVADVSVEGNDQTSDGLVREQLEIEVGEPLDLNALSRSRRNLYATKAFSLVDIAREDLASSGGDRAGARALGTIAPPAGQTDQAAQPGQKPVRLNVSVREVQPIQIRYGFSYDTERALGGVFDIANHNTLGRARVIGFRSRYDGEVTDLRGYITQPSLLRWPVETIATIYYRDERNPETTLTDPFNIDRRGASIQQERRLANAYVWNWGLRYERARTFDPRLETASDFTTVTPLTTSLSRETRDDVLDATRGSFLSHAFQYSPSWLGSDDSFITYFGQYSHYVPLQPERRERFTNEIIRPRFVYAGSVRLGIAKPFGDGEVPRSERFFAGGSTTLRGFEQNAVGGVDIEGLPTGGEALFVINNELRFPLVSIFDGVVFSDIGNVYRSISDFSLTDLRKTAGLGLRVRTPWFLVRGDYGLILDRRAGEPRGRFYFSIGQAF